MEDHERSKLLLTELRRHKDEFNKRWEGQWLRSVECCLILQAETWEIQGWPELNLGRDVKSNRGFYKCLSSKMEAGANVVPLLNGHGELVKNDMEKAKALPLLQVLLVRSDFMNLWSPRPKGKSNPFFHSCLFLLSLWGSIQHISPLAFLLLWVANSSLFQPDLNVSSGCVLHFPDFS